MTFALKVEFVWLTSFSSLTKCSTGVGSEPPASSLMKTCDGGGGTPTLDPTPTLDTYPITLDPRHLPYSSHRTWGGAHPPPTPSSGGDPGPPTPTPSPSPSSHGTRGGMMVGGLPPHRRCSSRWRPTPPPAPTIPLNQFPPKGEFYTPEHRAPSEMSNI